MAKSTRRCEFNSKLLQEAYLRVQPLQTRVVDNANVTVIRRGTSLWHFVLPYILELTSVNLPVRVTAYYRIRILHARPWDYIGFRDRVAGE